MYFTTANKIKASPTESIIGKGLVARKIKFAREVMFDGLINPKTGFKLRYDFYLPDKNMVVEYDGKKFHEDEDVRERDLIKNRFAKDNGIKLVRLSGLKSIDTFFETYFKPLDCVNANSNKHKRKKGKKKKKCIEVSFSELQSKRLKEANTVYMKRGEMFDYKKRKIQ